MTLLIDQIENVVHASTLHENSQIILHTWRIAPLTATSKIVHTSYIKESQDPFISRFNPDHCRLNVIHMNYPLTTILRRLRSVISFGFGYDEYALYIILRNTVRELDLLDLKANFRPTTSPIFFMIGNNDTGEEKNLLLRLCQICKEDDVLINASSSSLLSSINNFGEAGYRNFNGNTVENSEHDECDKSSFTLVRCKPLTQLVMTASERYNFSIRTINILKGQTEEERRLGRAVTVFQRLDLRYAVFGTQQESTVIYGSLSYVAIYCEKKLRSKATRITFWLEPYDTATWTLLVLMVLILNIILGKFSVKATSNSILEIWRMLCRQDYKLKHFLYLILGPSFMILNLNYEAIVTSILTMPSPPATYENFKELFNANYKVLAETLSTPGGGGVQQVTEVNIENLIDYLPQYNSGFKRWLGKYYTLNKNNLKLFFELINVTKCGDSRRACFENPNFDLRLLTISLVKK
ncbi:unnamed protein product [Orchesella dallaii]|uniref:Uncharacterized protein n=1 Tax=Orchesella dallaii TaxID=48710 RepID=A0ABP1RF68_9HEXA